MLFWSQLSCKWMKDTLYLQQPKGGLPGLADEQLLDIDLPLSDSPKRWMVLAAHVGIETFRLEAVSVG